MEEQSLLLDTIANVIEREGLVLEDRQLDSNSEKEDGQLSHANKVVHTLYFNGFAFKIILLTATYGNSGIRKT